MSARSSRGGEQPGWRGRREGKLSTQHQDRHVASCTPRFPSHSSGLPAGTRRAARKQPVEMSLAPHAPTPPRPLIKLPLHSAASPTLLHTPSPSLAVPNLLPPFPTFCRPQPSPGHPTKPHHPSLTLLHVTQPSLTSTKLPSITPNPPTTLHSFALDPL